MYCEVVVKDVLPALRSLVTKELLQNYEMSQTEVSKKLGITQPAVSQYKKELRGNLVKRLQKDRDVIRLVKILSKKIAKGKMTSGQTQTNFLELSRKIIQKELTINIPCRICFKS
jgi:hypothetical protein